MTKEELRKIKITQSINATETMRKFLKERKGLPIEEVKEQTKHYYNTYKRGFSEGVDYVYDNLFPQIAENYERGFMEGQQKGMEEACRMAVEEIRIKIECMGATIEKEKLARILKEVSNED